MVIIRGGAKKGSGKSPFLKMATTHHIPKTELRCAEVIQQKLKAENGRQ